MNNIDIFDKVASFIKKAKKKIVIHSNNFDVSLYFNPSVHKDIKKLLSNGVSIEIYYEKPEDTEKALETIKEEYNNFSFFRLSSQPQEAKLPDFIIVDTDNLLIFNKSAIKTEEKSDEVKNRISILLNFLNDLKLTDLKTK